MKKKLTPIFLSLGALAAVTANADNVEAATTTGVEAATTTGVETISTQKQSSAIKEVVVDVPVPEVSSVQYSRDNHKTEDIEAPKLVEAKTNQKNYKAYNHAEVNGKKVDGEEAEYKHNSYKVDVKVSDYSDEITLSDIKFTKTSGGGYPELNKPSVTVKDAFSDGVKLVKGDDYTFDLETNTIERKAYDRSKGTKLFEVIFEISGEIGKTQPKSTYDLSFKVSDKNGNTETYEKAATLNVVDHQDRLEIVKGTETKKVDTPYKLTIKYIPANRTVYYDEDGNVFLEKPASSSVKEVVLGVGESKIVVDGVKGKKTVRTVEEKLQGVVVNSYEEDVDVTSTAKNQVALVGDVRTTVEDRIAGENRYKGSVELSKKGWTDKTDQKNWGKHGTHVFVVNGNAFADALTGTPLAAANEAPILLINGDSLNDPVKNEINRLRGIYKGDKLFTVTILGGTSSVSSQVEDELKSLGVLVNRLGGVNRYEQAYLVAEKMAVINKNDNKTIYVATGEDFSDALNIAVKAGENNSPILLTNGNKLNKHAKKFIEDNATVKYNSSSKSVDSKGTTTVEIIGGTASVASAVEDAINEILAAKLDESIGNVKPEKAPTVVAKRTGGKNRYEVNRNINTLTGVNKYLVVSGDDASDVLPASAYANRVNALNKAAKKDDRVGVLLVNSDNKVNLNEQIKFATGKDQGVLNYVVVGGTNTISEETEKVFQNPTEYITLSSIGTPKKADDSKATTETTKEKSDIEKLAEAIVMAVKGEQKQSSETQGEKKQDTSSTGEETGKSPTEGGSTEGSQTKGEATKDPQANGGSTDKSSAVNDEQKQSSETQGEKKQDTSSTGEETGKSPTEGGSTDKSSTGGGSTGDPQPKQKNQEA